MYLVSKIVILLLTSQCRKIDVMYVKCSLSDNFRITVCFEGRKTTGFHFFTQFCKGAFEDYKT